VTSPAVPDDAMFARYRAYLRLAAAIRVDPRLRAKFDTSDVVQQTMLEAWKAWDQHAGEGDAQLLAWLHKMLTNNLLDAIKRFDAEKRDVGRERSLEESVNATVDRLMEMQAVDHTTPSDVAMREERDLKVAEAVAALPEDQREAVILKRWHGWTIDEIAEWMGKTPGGVAGLLGRALQTLRRALSDYGP
jgi:RNA polymerase sigma-70 factor (ECF subfamily)